MLLNSKNVILKYDNDTEKNIKRPKIKHNISTVIRHGIEFFPKLQRCF